jgi:tRNA nucleotidyltransferase (CCA-adding enzyme)
VVRLLERCDAFRRPQRFDALLFACECDARGRAGLAQRDYPQRPRLWAALQAALAIDAAAVAAAAAERGAHGPAIGDAVRAARIDAVATAIAPPASPAG